jgi:hypothetical protein
MMCANCWSKKTELSKLSEIGSFNRISKRMSKHHLFKNLTQQSKFVSGRYRSNTTHTNQIFRGRLCLLILLELSRGKNDSLEVTDQEEDNPRCVMRETVKQVWYLLYWCQDTACLVWHEFVVLLSHRHSLDVQTHRFFFIPRSHAWHREGIHNLMWLIDTVVNLHIPLQDDEEGRRGLFLFQYFSFLIIISWQWVRQESDAWLPDAGLLSIKHLSSAALSQIAREHPIDSSVWFSLQQ